MNPLTATSRSLATGLVAGLFAIGLAVPASAAPPVPLPDPVQNPGGTLADTAASTAQMPQVVGATSPSPISVEEARTRLLGKGYDNPGIVRGRVVGNTTWLMSYGGTIVLHDATIEDNFSDTGKNVNTNGFVNLADVLAAKPQVILLGHSHFDHVHNLAEIAAQTGAPVVSSLSTCGWVKLSAIRQGFKASDITCNLLREADGTPMNDADSYFTMPWGGEGVVYSAFGSTGKPERPLPGGLQDSAVLVKHTATFNRPPTYPDQYSPGVNINPQDSIDRMAKNPGVSYETMWRQFAPFDLEGGNYLHKVTYNGFTVAHHGSTGATSGLDPGAPEILNALKSLGKDGRIDVEIGGIVEASYANTNYFKDAKEYSKAIDAKLYFPVHHFDWYSYWLTSPAVSYFPGMQKTWADAMKERNGNFPKLCFLTDGEHAPNNYATLWQFNIADWRGNHTGQAIPLTGPGCYSG
jgi:L-ascorbate metabolism protein UlaG (beta-lactamase superfamily)